MLPVLRFAAKGEVKTSEAVQSLADQFHLSEKERSALLPSGQRIFANRVNWAKTYLSKAGLIELTRRSYFQITEQGHKVLISSPQKIDTNFLKQFPEFVLFLQTGHDASTSGKGKSQATKVVQTDSMTPDEIIQKVHAELENRLGFDLLTRVIAAPPDFFEHIVVQLLLAMGYGGSTSNAGRVLGRSGDDSVDGVIDQDALGLDCIYVQAKRYAIGNNVSPGEIRNFLGSLDLFKAAKGLFVTTSSFSTSARKTAESLSKRIVLINGSQLAKLMIRYNVGCRVEETIQLKKIDEEFFE